MNLEAHPALHYAVVLLFYNVGMAMNVLSAAHLSINSQNNAVKTLKSYFSLRWPPLVVRWTVCTFVFLIGWENPTLNLERFMPTFTIHMGVAGFLGFASDEFTSKVLAVLGFQKELPAVPDDRQGPGS